VDVISSRLLLVTGSVAASLAGIVPAGGHGTAARVTQSPAGLTVSAADSTSSIVVPMNKRVLRGLAFGNVGYAKRVRLTVVRAADGATLFTGSLATFHTLPVLAGTKLVVTVQTPDARRGVRAGASLTWS
jgi:hypothetical protein